MSRYYVNFQSVDMTDLYESNYVQQWFAKRGISGTTLLASSSMTWEPIKIVDS